MNAVNPILPSQRQPDRPSDRQAEPSMEEILASIRRIIADDQAMPEAPPPRGGARERAVEAAAFDDAPALEAYGQVTAPQFPSPSGPPAPSAPTAEADAPDLPSRRRDGDDEAGDLDAPASDGPADRRHASAPPPAAAVPGASAITPQQEDSMRDQLARDPDAAHDPSGRSLPTEAAPRGGSLFSDATDRSLSSAFSMLAATRLVDDSEELRAMAREMVRPLLKDWLDDNLPSLVERLVRAEIERVARGGR